MSFLLFCHPSPQELIAQRLYQQVVVTRVYPEPPSPPTVLGLESYRVPGSALPQRVDLAYDLSEKK